jgi:hypothetical protein
MIGLISIKITTEQASFCHGNFFYAKWHYSFYVSTSVHVVGSICGAFQGNILKFTWKSLEIAQKTWRLFVAYTSLDLYTSQNKSTH